jgi:hypothetical protein
MNNQEAKFILSAYRSSGADANNAVFAEALQQVKQDPALAEWFSRTQAHDAAVAKKLGQIQPPAGLREAILTGARVSRSAPAQGPWRWMALAAAVAVLLVGGGVMSLRKSADVHDPLTTLALSDTAFDRHGGYGEEVKLIQAKLSEPTTRLTAGLPLDLNALRNTGCRTIALDGQEVFEVCFNRNGTWFHLYATKADASRMTNATTEPTFHQRDRFCCASWSDARTGLHYAVIGEGNTEAFRSLL